MKIIEDILSQDTNLDWLYLQKKVEIDAKIKRRQSQSIEKISYFVIHHDEERLRSEFSDKDQYSDFFSFVNLNDIDLPPSMVFEGMDINQNKAMYSEFLFILNLDVSTVETEFIGLFTYSIPFKSRKYSNVDLNVDHFLFPDLTRINTNALSLDKFYSVSILPRVLPWRQEFDGVCEEYWNNQGYQFDGIIPYFSSGIMSTNNFKQIQCDLKSFFEWAKTKYGFNVGIESKHSSTFGDCPDVRHNLGDYGGLLEKGFGYICSKHFGCDGLEPLGKLTENSRLPFHSRCDLKPEPLVYQTYAKYAECIRHLADANLIQSDQGDVLVTYITSGYISMCDNLIHSLKECGIDHLLTIACLDQESFEYYKNRGASALYFDSDFDKKTV